MTQKSASPVGRLRLVQYPGLGGRSTLSPPCGKVHMALAYKSLPYEVVTVTTPMQAKRFNPRGRVPTLLVDERTVVDSTDILLELERLSPDPALVPDRPKASALAAVWEDWADEVLYFYGVWLRWCDPEGYARLKRHVLATLPIPVRWIVPSIARREVSRRAKGQGIGVKEPEAVRREFTRGLDGLAAVVSEEPFLVGERFTHADLAVAAVVDQLRVEKLTPWAASEIGARESILSWIERVRAHVPDATRTDI